MDPGDSAHPTESRFMQRLRKISNHATARRPSFGSNSSPSNAKPHSPLVPLSPPAPPKNDTKSKRNLEPLVHHTTALMAVSGPQVSEIVVTNGTYHAVTPTRENFHQADDGDVTASWTAWSGLKLTLGAVHAVTDMFPPLKLAVGTLLSCFEVAEKVTTNRQHYDEFTSHLSTLADILEEHLHNTKSTDMERCIHTFAGSIEQEVKTISDKSRQSKLRASLNARIDEHDLALSCRRLDAVFHRLQLNVGLYTWSITNDTFVTMILDDMRPAKMAHYNSSLGAEINRRACTDNTRTGIRSQLDQWYRGQALSSSNVFWVWGMPGTGKSTIAYTLARDLERRNQLAATFFCSRSSSDCRDVNRILPTIAYQLAQRSSLYRAALCGILHEDRHSSTQVIHTQYERLIKEPIQKVGPEFPQDLVVVIDALDELKDKTTSGLRCLLEVICQTGVDLPLKFFITSRPEASIKSIPALENGCIHVAQLHQIEISHVKADIELYLEEELKHISPASHDIKQLAEQSGALFIYAATLIRYIRPQEQGIGPINRLKSALAMVPNPTMRPAEMNTLYTALLEGVLDESNDPQEVSDRKLVLWTVIRAMEPLGVETLTRLVGFNSTSRTLLALQALSSVLHIPQDNGIICPLHASLRDFMNWAKGDFNPLSFDSDKHHHLLARHCFRVMKQDLRFNICGLKSSYVMDKEVEGLQYRVENTITPVLFYASRFWGVHLALAHNHNPGQLRDLLFDFLSSRLLYWMEVLNLKLDIGIGEQALLEAFKWLKVCQIAAQSDHLLTATINNEIEGSQASLDGIKLVNDCRNFVAAFTSNPICWATPHIYLSALPLRHRSSLVVDKYRGCIQGFIDPSGVVMERRGVASLATWKAPPATISAFSADTKLIALGCNDYSIAVRDARTGTLLHGPFNGHSNSVSALAFSPNGTLMASGSQDETICIWDLRNNITHTLNPLKGHQSKVNTIAFASRKLMVVSGSEDGNIRVWTSRENKIDDHMAYTLGGHTKSVTSVCFSHDDMYIASCSEDKTVRIWYKAEGTYYTGLQMIEGAATSLNSVVFSPDSTRVVSGTSGGMISIWQAKTGKKLILSFRAHTSSVVCLGFPYHRSGEYFASGSSDGTIAVWDVKNGKMVAGPFEGHVLRISSLSFSPDATRIISSSKDGTIRTWNAFAGIAPPKSPIDHLTFVNAVTFTADDKCIASASSNSTVCVFNASSGALVSGPFRNNNPLPTRAAAFSRDCTRVAFSSGNDGDKLQVCATEDGQHIGMEFEGHRSFICSVAFSSNRKIVATGSDDSSIRLWRAKRHSYHLALLGKLPNIKDLGGPILSLCFSPDGTKIASGCGDASIRVWYAGDGSPVTSFTPSQFESHTGPVTTLTFSPDESQIASGSDDCTIRLRYSHNGQHTVGPLKGHKESTNSIAFSQDGSYIISGSNDHTICIWDVRTGNLVGTPLVGHTAPIRSVAFSRNGKRVVSGSDDSTTRVWNTSDMDQDDPITNLDSPSSPDREVDSGGTYTQVLIFDQFKLTFGRHQQSIMHD
ncbi:unnamed protein product [Rhizoctonia solani]|uniref:Nephrocystin 3-like N-terminal domain-containing protein n=1 Tax=Rhizoctonia solani TaxID=456999 RepID=A0A8H2WXH0_9AGAM|nr:unnamed protein product [Rhizoctonia solani]